MFKWIGDQSFSGKAGELRYKSGIVSGDVNGDGVLDLQIEVANSASLTASDFLL